MKAVEHLKEITRERINLSSNKEDVERVARRLHPSSLCTRL